MTFLKESGYERTLEKLEQETNLKSKICKIQFTKEN